MGENTQKEGTPKSIEALPKKMPWVVVDPMIDRTAKILSIVGGLYLVITQIIAPHIEFINLIVYVLMLLWWFYQWRTKENYLVGHTTQSIIIMLIVISCFQIVDHFSRSSPFSKAFGVAWTFITLGWVSLRFIASFETDRDLKSQMNDLIGSQNRIVDVLNSVTEMHNSMLDFHNTHFRGSNLYIKFINEAIAEKEKAKHDDGKAEERKESPPDLTLGG